MTSESSANSTPSGGSHYQPALPVVLIILVLFVGSAFVMLRSTTPAPAGSSTTPSTSSTTTTTVAQSREPRAKVSVQVLNGTNISGLAGTYTHDLLTLNWDTLPATNGPSTTRTIVYYNKGFQWAASEIAATLKVPSSSVTPLDGRTPVSGASGDDVIVLLGPNVHH